MSDKLTEMSVIIQDRIKTVGKMWWIAFILVLVLSIPAFFVLRSVFEVAIFKTHTFPAFIYEVPTNQPLQVVDKKIFQLNGNTYYGYVRIKNPNLLYGSDNQGYTAVFSSTGGTELNKVAGTSFILPSSEKIIVFPRFQADKQPTQLNFTLADTKFIHAPNRITPNLEVSRTSFDNINNQFVVSSAVKNKTAFTITKIGFPVLLYDKSNNVVGANFTNINDVKYLETRTFQMTWPTNPGAVRAEVLPEVNIFDNNIYAQPEGQSQF